MRVALDAIERARFSNPTGKVRHTICHTELVDEADVLRFTTLDVIAQTTPVGHTEQPDQAKSVMSDENRLKLYPFRSIATSGARTTFGSDFPFGGGLPSLVPMYNIEVGITRRWPESNNAALPPLSEMLDLKTLIRGYTAAAAYQLRLDHLVGSIEVGKRADLVILDKDIFSTAVGDLHDVKVAMTLVDGEVVYERPFYQWLIEWWLEI